MTNYLCWWVLSFGVEALWKLTMIWNLHFGFVLWSVYPLKLLICLLLICLLDVYLCIAKINLSSLLHKTSTLLSIIALDF